MVFLYSVVYVVENSDTVSSHVLFKIHSQIAYNCALQLLDLQFKNLRVVRESVTTLQKYHHERLIILGGRYNVGPFPLEWVIQSHF